MNRKDSLNYEVVLYRTDIGPVLVHTDSNKEKAKKLVDSLGEQWGDCVKKQTPFHLKSPFYSFFDPGIIREISIQETTINAGIDNPYQQEMVNKGFSQSFKTNTEVQKSPYSDLLDEGYK